MYKKAFECKKCPQRGDSEGCPAWMEVVMTDKTTGEVKSVGDCSYKLLPRIIIENTAAADRVTANLTEVPKRIREELPLLAMRFDG